MFCLLIKSKILLLIHFVAAFVLLFSFSCEKREHINPLDPNYEGAGKPSIQKVTFSGILQLIPGSTVQVYDLKAESFAQSSNLGENDNFSIQSNQADKCQALFINHKITNNIICLGLFNPLINNLAANDTSTVLALTLFNPYLIYTNQTQPQQYIQAAKQTTKFSQLLALIKNAYQADAKTALQYETNPTIYQVACQIMKEAMQNLGGSMGLSKSANGMGTQPHLED